MSIQSIHYGLNLPTIPLIALFDMSLMKKTTAQYENLQVEEHRGNILIIERTCAMDDVMIIQQYTLLAEWTQNNKQNYIDGSNQ